MRHAAGRFIWVPRSPPLIKLLWYNNLFFFLNLIKFFYIHYTFCLLGRENFWLLISQSRFSRKYLYFYQSLIIFLYCLMVNLLNSENLSRCMAYKLWCTFIFLSINRKVDYPCKCGKPPLTINSSKVSVKWFWGVQCISTQVIAFLGSSHWSGWDTII